MLAGVLPLDLEVKKWGRLARCRRLRLGKEEEKRVEEEGFAEWQARWEASEMGRITYRFFPMVKERLKCSWLEVGHESSQFLTEHVAFMAYLDRFSKPETDECQSCGATDTMEHVVFDCVQLASARRALRNLIVGDGQQWPCDLRHLVCSPGIFREFRRFMREAVVLRGHVSGRVDE